MALMEHSEYISQKVTQSENNTLLINSSILLAAALLFIPFLGGVHLFDWDEINFAESAREMIVSKDYLNVQINFISFWEKPPLFIWMQVLSMKIFGINEFAARFPNAICGIVSLLVIFNIGRKTVSTKFGLVWLFLYAGSILPFFYFKSGIIDPWFNLFIFLGVFGFYSYCQNREPQIWYAAGSGFFIGLAILTKGPVAFLIFALTAGIYLVYKRFSTRIKIKDLAIFILFLAFTGGFWFILQILQGHFSVIADFIIYQIRLFRTEDAGHGGFLFYHFVILFIGVFPASVFALPVLLGSKYGNEQQKNLYTWMLILFWVVLLLFTLVKTKIVHYSSMCYFPLTFMAAWSIYNNDARKKFIHKLVKPLIVGTGILLALLIGLLTYIDHFKAFVIEHHLLHDPFAVKCLSASGEWKGFEVVAGVVLLAGIITYIAAGRKKEQMAVYALTGFMVIFIFLSMVMIVPRVEAYSQRAAVEFFQSVSDKDVYLETVGYKSYTHLFYGKIKDHENSLSKDEKWLLTGRIDKDAYFSVKVTSKENFISQYPDTEYLYEKNGFVFFKRSKQVVLNDK